MIHVNRSKTVPPSLVESKAEDRFRNDDVVKQLAEDSGYKCYLCEISPVSDPEVEHLLPHKGGKYPERKYDWNNLFYACSHCNKVKNKPKYDDGIIDCCVVDPEELIDQELEENRVHVRPRSSGLDSDPKVKLKTELIEEVFMTDRPELRKHASAARMRELQLNMNMFYRQLLCYINDEKDAYAKRILRRMLQRTAAFSGFTRCYIRKHRDDYPELAEYLSE